MKTYILVIFIPYLNLVCCMTPDERYALNIKNEDAIKDFKSNLGKNIITIPLHPNLSRDKELLRYVKKHYNVTIINPENINYPRDISYEITHRHLASKYLNSKYNKHGGENWLKKAYMIVTFGKKDYKKYMHLDYPKNSKIGVEN